MAPSATVVGQATRAAAISTPASVAVPMAFTAPGGSSAGAVGVGALAAATAPSQASSSKRSFSLGDIVEAQAPGWGDEWHPGRVRDLLAGGEIQVLWDGDEPSISNVPPAHVRLKPGAHRGEAVTAVASADDKGATGLVTSTLQRAQEPAREPLASDSACASSGGGSPDTTQSSALPGTTPSSMVAPNQYCYDLGPGDDITTPIAHLRRRVEQEHRDGFMVALSVRITRPAGRPEVEARAGPVPAAAAAAGPPLAAGPPRSADAAAGAALTASA